MALTSGTELSPYEIQSPLGAGGMGEVYRARDTRLERTVAIKILPQQLSNDPVRKQRLEREAKTISNLNHPHICVLHDIGHQDGLDCLVMECIEGESEMLTGQRAFPGKSQLSAASAILEKEPAPISLIKPLTPPALDHGSTNCAAAYPSNEPCKFLKWSKPGEQQFIFVREAWGFRYAPRGFSATSLREGRLRARSSGLA